MGRKALFLVLTLVLAGALASEAWAQFVPLGSLGPPSPSNGFPTFVTDSNGVSLDLPTPPYGNGITAPTMVFDPVIPTNLWSVATGFGAEAFFYLAESVIDQPNGGKALLVLGIEAAYGAENPLNLPPDQFLFARVRVRFDAAVAGNYTVTHPWGVENLVLTAADVGTRFSHTYDWGGFAPSPLTIPVIPSSFERILYSPKQWRFLTADTKVVQVEGDQALIIGDGVSLTTVKGGLNGVNSFTIVGPANAFGPGANTVTSSLFTVSGHFAGVAIPTTGTVTGGDTVTITRARLRNNNVEVRATSSNGFAMTAELYSGGIGGILVGSGNLGTIGRGNISFSATPDSVVVHSTSTNPDILDGAASAPVPFP